MQEAPSPASTPADAPADSPAPPAAAPATEQRSTAFTGKPVAEDSVPGGTLLIAAYAVVWVVVLLLVARVFQRQSALARKVEELEADLGKPRANAPRAREGA